LHLLLKDKLVEEQKKAELEANLTPEQIAAKAAKNKQTTEKRNATRLKNQEKKAQEGKDQEQKDNSEPAVLPIINTNPTESVITSSPTVMNLLPANTTVDDLANTTVDDPSRTQKGK
jgi:hypothetical protein